MRRNVNATPAWAARRGGDVVETHRQPSPAGARRKREEERGGSGPGDRGGGLSAELKYDPAVRSHSATTVTMRLTKRPYTCVNVSRGPSSTSLGYKIVSCYSIADVTPTAYTNQRCTNKTLCVTCVVAEVVVLRLCTMLPSWCITVLSFQSNYTFLSLQFYVQALHY